MRPGLRTRPATRREWTWTPACAGVTEGQAVRRSSDGLVEQSADGPLDSYSPLAPAMSRRWNSHSAMAPRMTVYTSITSAP